MAHRADNRYFNNDTAAGKQGARGNIYFLFSQMCRAHYIRNMSGSIRVSLTVAYSLMIRHGAHKYKIITTANRIYRNISPGNYTHVRHAYANKDFHQSLVPNIGHI